MSTPFQFSNYLEKKVLSLLFENTAYTSPSTVYLGLFTAFTTASDGDAFTEVSSSGTGYARQAVSFAAPSLSSTSNAVTFDFPVATSNWGTVIYFGIFDAVTSGNLLYWGPIVNATAINTGQQFEVSANTLQVNLTGNITDYAANAILNHTLRHVPFTSPATVYTGLFTSYTSDVVNTENPDANYVRQAATFITPANTITTVSNTADISFPVAAAQYTAVYSGIFDASSGGNLMLRGPLSPTVTVASGKILKFPVGNLTLSAD